MIINKNKSQEAFRKHRRLDVITLTMSMTHICKTCLQFHLFTNVDDSSFDMDPSLLIIFKSFWYTLSKGKERKK